MCPVPIHDASSRLLFTKNHPVWDLEVLETCMRGLKLVEKSIATLLKKTRQINDTNKKLEPVESKKLFWCQKIFNQLELFICIVI